MKKFRHTLSFLMAFVMLLSTSIPAFAADTTAKTTEESAQLESIMNPDEETMFAQMMAQLPSDEENLLADGLIGKESLGQQVTIRDGTRSTNAITYYYPSLNMPGATFYIVTLGWEDGDYTIATYNGHSCYKFVRDDKIVYVRTTAFYPNITTPYDQSNKYPSDSIISTRVTNYLNNGNSAFYYSGRWRIYNADGLQYVQLAVYGTQAFKFEEDEIVLQHKVITSSGMLALINVTAPKYPTLKLEITNTGLGRRYLGGYYIKGLGSNTSVNDIADLILLGYKTAKVAAGAVVSNLSFDDVASLFETVVSLNKSGILNISYLSDTIPLSNTYENVYSYSCSLASPFALEHVGDYFQTHIGLNGADGTSLSYRVTVSSSSTPG